MDQDKLVISQKKLKLLLGGLGIALPTMVYLGNYWIYGESEILPSLSSYYHSGMRDLFVGVLFSIGLFLIAYEGYTTGDRLLSSLAGTATIIVALFPTAMEGQERNVINTIHLASAGLFFLVVSIFALFKFTQTDEANPTTVRKRLRNTIYRISGLLTFISLIVLIVTETGLVSRPIENSTFWFEYIGLSAFGTAWIVKGEGVFFLNDDSIFNMDPWEVLGIVILVLLLLGSFAMLSIIAFI